MRPAVAHGTEVACEPPPRSRNAAPAITATKIRNRTPIDPMISDHDTIVAPATAHGGAISVIRVSGSGALAVCDCIFRGKTALSRAAGYTVHYGRIADGPRTIDDVLATVFRAPHSYTGEDSVEISCHGSSYVVAEILRLLIASGARMARPGEFTVRAFLAGKMDLSQAEAVADLIASSSQAAHALASNQMRGGYSSALGQLRDRLLHLASLLELELDFSEEEVEFADRRQLRETIERIAEQIDRLRDSFRLGNALKEGVAVALVGAPNVGKSTLLNRLLNEERAMVSDIAGTTRDVIEESCVIDGIRFRFLDTAGIRTTHDRLEQMGIERTMSSIARAAIIVRMVDASSLGNAPIPPPDFAVRTDQTLLTVLNKLDAAPARRLPEEAIGISAKCGDGIPALREALCRAVDATPLYRGNAVVSSSRHYEALTAAREALDRALRGLSEGLTPDLLSEEIRQVIHHLGTITGEITSDDILHDIFSKFCIGK